jgi:hypothetical protein
MKGSLHTDELMREVVAGGTGLRTERRVSHVFVMDVPAYPEPLFVTDAAINIVPDLEAKADIVRNAIELHLGLGLGTPRVAILSAVETVTPKLPGTLEAAALCKMAERGQIAGGLLDGPLALDTAISPEAARIKGLGRRWRAGRRSWSCPTSRPATCWRRTSPSSPERTRRHRAGRPGADHPHQPGRRCAHPHGVLRGRGLLCPPSRAQPAIAA